MATTAKIAKEAIDPPDVAEIVVISGLGVIEAGRMPLQAGLWRIDSPSADRHLYCVHV